MPPRKRRQSAQGEDLGKETNEIQAPSLSTEADKSVKGSSKVPDGSAVSNLPERRLTARQQSKQDALLENAEKQKEATAASAESTAKLPTRFSTRVVKRPRRDISPESPVKKGKKAAGTCAPVVNVVTTPETKGKRPWELWSVEDKDSFFEGLCEFGKDFESIHNLIVTKCRKKGSVMPITVKNKEQVRHFYYRTWHKISKLIQPVESLKKDIQELYGLISYSVLRKKIRGGVNPSDKNWQKLNELVHQGVATIKVKGKRIRVKTPICNALKKLNNYEDPKREPGPRVPEKIQVEFRPKTNSAWQHVQDLSQNPRLRVAVKPDRNLQSLIKFLNQKWKSHRLKTKESMNETETLREEFRVYPHHDSIVKCIDLDAIDEPVLQFCLTKHSKDDKHTSPTSNKRKKDKEGCSGNKPSTSVSCNETSDQSKPVINNFNFCVCKDSCKTCTSHKDPSKTTNAAKDFFKSFGNKDSGKCCVCKCGDNKNMPTCSKGGTSVTSSAPQSDSLTDLTGISMFSGLNCCPAVSPTNSSKKSKSPVPFSQTDTEVPRASQTCMQKAQTFSVPELSAIVAGENAMFPDLLHFQDANSSVTNSQGPDNVKIEMDNPEIANYSKEAEPRHSEVETTINDDGCTQMSSHSSQSEMERICRDIMNQGWTVEDEENVTIAELYLMFGQNGNLKFEYEWIQIKTKVEIIQEKLLLNLNNMLRRLSHLATVEFTDFTKAPGVGSACQLCGHVQGSRQKGKDKSPISKVKASKDVQTQTIAPPVPKKDVPICPAPPVPPAGCNGVFRVPVVTPNMGGPQRPGHPMSSREFIQRMNPTINKPLMRPRKLKSVSRSRPTPPQPGNIAIGQRTILPKNHTQMVTFYPMVQTPRMPGDPGAEKEGLSQTIVGHPISGIQTQPVTMVTNSLPCMVSSTLNHSQYDTPLKTNTSSSIGVMEISLSPDGDQTLMRIPAAHLATMSQEALKAAGMTALPTTPGLTLHGGAVPLSTSTPYTKSSLSPPNLSSLLDMSSADGSKYLDLDGEASFSSLLDVNSKVLTGDPLNACLVTPPIHNVTSGCQTTQHSPPVRSLFTSSPSVDTQWLNGDTDLSLTGFLQSPCKTSLSSHSTNTQITHFNLFSESSRDSQSHKIDVDSTLHSMMNESSIDYVKKFADLAEQITSETSTHKKTETFTHPL